MYDSENPELAKNRTRFWLRLLKVTNLVESEIRRRMKAQLNITLPQFDVMAALSGPSQGLRMCDISKKLKVSPGNVTVVVDRLVEQNLAQRLNIPGDRRALLVELTDEGREKFSFYAIKHEAWIDEILDLLSDSEAKSITKVMEKLSKSIM